MEWCTATLLSLTGQTVSVGERLAQVSKVLEDVEKNSILDMVSPLSLFQVFCFGIFHISIKAERFKMIKIDELDKDYEKS